MNAIRITLNEKLVTHAMDLAGQIESTRRVFLHNGNLITAIADVRRITSAFDLKVQKWEAEVTEFTRDKRGMSGQQIQRMKAEIARVRHKVGLTRRVLSKLKTELHHAGHDDPELDPVKESHSTSMLSSQKRC